MAAGQTPLGPRRRVWGAPLLGACFAISPIVLACDKGKTGEAAASASASAAAAPGADKPRCGYAETGASFAIGKRSPEGKGEGVSLPFAVELGSAVPRPTGFAVGALRSEGGGTGAVVALVGETASSGQVIELGRTHGDVDPPRVASRGDRLVVVVPDNDAGSSTLRLAALAGRNVTWGATFQQGRDESQAFAVELGAKRGLLVWDEWVEKEGHGAIRVTSFAVGDVSNATPAKNISPDGTDAQTPQLSPRAGGFWLAWVAQEVVTESKGSKSRKRDDSFEELPTNRWVEVAPVDENGALSAKPVAITPKNVRVMIFDLATTADGAAVLAWRTEENAATEGGQLHLTVVKEDGSIDATVVEDRDLGPGAPTLVVDRHKQQLWLSVASMAEETRLARVKASGDLVDGLAVDPIVKNAEPLAAHDGHLLLGRPAGLAIELEVVRCRAGAPPQYGSRPPKP